MNSLDEARELTDILIGVRLQRLEMQVDLYRKVMDQVRKTIPLLAGEGEGRDNSLIILSRLCDICEEMEIGIE